MKPYSILALAILAAGISTGAQNSASTQPGVSAQAQANSSASASASATAPPNTAPSKSAAASGSASGDASGSASATGNPLNIPSGTTVPATLVTPLDAKHNKPGDPVVAKTTQDVKENGQTVLKKGSRLNGHITQVAEHSSGNAQSALGVVFDSAVTKSGQQVPMNMSIQALAASTSQMTAAADGDSGMIDSAGQAGFTGAGAVPMAPAAGGVARGSGGALGGVGGTVGGVTNTAATSTGSAGRAVNGANGTGRATTSTLGSANTGGLNSAGQLTSGSSGVFGLQGLNLSSAVNNGTTASVVNSTGHNVHLDSGTQMVLQVVNQ